MERMENVVENLFLVNFRLSNTILFFQLESVAVWKKIFNFFCFSSSSSFNSCTLGGVFLARKYQEQVDKRKSVCTQEFQQINEKKKKKGTTRNNEKQGINDKISMQK